MPIGFARVSSSEYEFTLEPPTRERLTLNPRSRLCGADWTHNLLVKRLAVLLAPGARLPNGEGSPGVAAAALHLAIALKQARCARAGGRLLCCEGDRRVSYRGERLRRPPGATRHRALGNGIGRSRVGAVCWRSRVRGGDDACAARAACARQAGRCTLFKLPFLRR
jgi:hypothetical protein